MDKRDDRASRRRVGPGDERPSRRAAEQRDELAPLKLSQPHSVTAARGKMQDIELASDNPFKGWPSHHMRPSTRDAEKHPASRMAAGSCAQIESLARAYERPALRKPFAAFPADTKVA